MNDDVEDYLKLTRIFFFFFLKKLHQGPFNMMETIVALS